MYPCAHKLASGRMCPCLCLNMVFHSALIAKRHRPRLAVRVLAAGVAEAAVAAAEGSPAGVVSVAASTSAAPAAAHQGSGDGTQRGAALEAVYTCVVLLAVRTVQCGVCVGRWVCVRVNVSVHCVCSVCVYVCMIVCVVCVHVWVGGCVRECVCVR